MVLDRLAARASHGEDARSIQAATFPSETANFSDGRSLRHAVESVITAACRRDASSAEAARLKGSRRLAFNARARPSCSAGRAWPVHARLSRPST